MTSYNEEGEISIKYKYQYEFDKIKNWIVRTQIGKNYQEITEREIEYYE